MATKLQSVYRLKCSCNEYPWGKTGTESIAARLCEKQPGWAGEKHDRAFQIDGSKPYAEMWMGTYPTLPSYIAETGEDLQDVLDRYPKELIGDQTLKKFGHSKLPFLPKVLSISKALPLQLHPNKELAAKLHEKDPENFTDSNHKPEIALAMSKFEAFCGFKPLPEIAELLRLDALKSFVPHDASVKALSKDHLKDVVRKMLEADDETIRATYKAITALPETDFGRSPYIAKLAPRLADQYSEADPGILVALVTMNYLVLEAGESIYIPADGIHAYLSGDIIEAMARSDNVLNTGFCPRADRNSAELFCSTMTFSPQSPSDCMLPPRSYPKSKQGKTRVFAPPLSEFDVLETELRAGETETLGAVGGPAILLATQGDATMTAAGEEFELNEGAVFFVAPGVELNFDSKAGIKLHIAFVEGSTS